MPNESKNNIEASNYIGGPKTEEGKAVSSQNSKTHGIFCSEFLSKEEEEEFEEIFKSLIEDFAIQKGTALALMIHQATMSFIVLRRINRIEANIIEEELNNPSKTDLNLSKLNLLARYKVSAENGIYKAFGLIEKVSDSINNMRFSANLRANPEMVKSIIGRFSSMNKTNTVI